jgi:hypothetical protein
MRRDETETICPRARGYFWLRWSLKALVIGPIIKTCKGFPIPFEINSGCENISVCVGVPSVGNKNEGK